MKDLKKIKRPMPKPIIWFLVFALGLLLLASLGPGNVWKDSGIFIGPQGKWYDYPSELVTLVK